MKINFFNQKKELYLQNKNIKNMQTDSKKHENPTDANNVLADVFIRNKTRGELFDNLSKGFKCEEETKNVEFVSLVLNAIIYHNKSNLKYKVYPSINEGWSIYEAVV